MHNKILINNAVSDDKYIFYITIGSIDVTPPEEGGHFEIPRWAVGYTKNSYGSIEPPYFETISTSGHHYYGLKEFYKIYWSNGLDYGDHISFERTDNTSTKDDLLYIYIKKDGQVLKYSINMNPSAVGEGYFTCFEPYIQNQTLKCYIGPSSNPPLGF